MRFDRIAVLKVIAVTASTFGLVAIIGCADATGLSK
jgi:hypothetical protein